MNKHVSSFKKISAIQSKPTSLTSTKERAVLFEKINFGYIKDKQAIKDVSFQIEKGKYVCIIGHNGSGKSTISKLLMGLVKPWSGQIVIGGKVLSLETLKLILNKMGLIFQNPDNQFIGITPRDDIAFGLENRKVPRDVIDNIINEVAKVIEIENLLEKHAADLSGGQKQKVAITSILAINPDVIIFDEATSMLDPLSKNEIKDLMVHLSRVERKTVISITHDMEELEKADEVLIMNHGALVAHTMPELLFKDPQFLLGNKLDLPFNLDLSHSLNEVGIKVKITNNLNNLIVSINKAGKK